MVKWLRLRRVCVELTNQATPNMTVTLLRGCPDCQPYMLQVQCEEVVGELRVEMQDPDDLLPDELMEQVIVTLSQPTTRVC